MKILVTGPQGSGKTTQAKLLANFLSVSTFGTGEALRKIAEEDTDMGKQIKDALDKGQMVDDIIVAKIVRVRVSEDDCKNGFVIDGYPRRMSQLEEFDPQFDKVFYLDVSDDIVLDRLLKRGRSDDTKDLINERLKLYHQLTEPILAYYKRLGILQVIDGSGSIDEIQNSIKEMVNG